MPVVEITRHIEAPPSEVWSFVSDIYKVPEWVTVTEEMIETTDNPVRKGTVYRELSKIGPSKSESEWRVTVFEPEDVQVHETEEPSFQATLTMKVEEEGEGTKFTHRTEYKLMPVFRPLGWLLEKLFASSMMERNLTQTVDNAARMIESSD